MGELVVYIIVGAIGVVCIWLSRILAKVPQPKSLAQLEHEAWLTKREARINRTKITPEEIEESDRLMQTEFFKEISLKMYNSASDSILNAARELKFFPTMREITYFVGMNDEELSSPFDRWGWLNVNLPEMGYKPIREVKQARIFMYSLGRITGFKFGSYLDRCLDGYNLRLSMDFNYWKEIYDKEYKKANDKKYNDNYQDLKDIFE